MRRCAFYSFNGALPLPLLYCYRDNLLENFPRRVCPREFPHRTSRRRAPHNSARVSVFTKRCRDANERSFINPVDYFQKYFSDIYIFFFSFAYCAPLCKVEYAKREFSPRRVCRETRVFRYRFGHSYSSLRKYSTSQSCLKLELVVPPPEDR
jgi:hypothetical protein